MRMWKGEISQEDGQGPLANIADETNNAAAASDSRRAKSDNDRRRIDEDDEMQSHEEEIDVAGREEEPRNECFVVAHTYIQTGEQRAGESE